METIEPELALLGVAIAGLLLYAIVSAFRLGGSE